MIVARIMLGIAILVLVPLHAQAYFSPEDVLLSKEFFLPPTKRETDVRVARQVEESRQRREMEQELLFSLQQPEEDLDEEPYSDELTEEEEAHAAAPEKTTLSEKDEDLLRAIHLIQTREDRLVDRIYANQNVLQHMSAAGIQWGPQGEILHGGAPLPPTGAGGVLTAITMIGAVGYTLWRAKRGEKAVWIRRPL